MEKLYQDSYKLISTLADTIVLVGRLTSVAALALIDSQLGRPSNELSI